MTRPEDRVAIKKAVAKVRESSAPKDYREYGLRKPWGGEPFPKTDQPDPITSWAQNDERPV